MCGIAGFLDFDKAPPAENMARLEIMTGALEHRGPNSFGVWSDKSSVFLGHRRLSILDLSPEGHQPMTSFCGRYVISFNGEIYNYLEIQKDLIDQGCDFKGHSDTEVLVAALSVWGLEKTLSVISGMFAFAIWDKKDRRLTLVRDQIGKKPLYFGMMQNRLYFCSELKSIQKLHKNDLKINVGAFNTYLQYGYVPSPHCIYDGFYKLLPGHTISFDIDNMGVNDFSKESVQRRMIMYWSMSGYAKKQKNFLEQGDIKRTLKDKLFKATEQRMISDVPIGAFLSGGIDSSLIVSIMQELSKNPVNTYTIGFEIDEFDESPYAKEVAKHLGTNHTTHIITDSETRSIIPKMGEIYDEPFSDISQIPTFHVCSMAAKDSTVILSGDGGDEIFCGYSRYFLTEKLFEKTKRVPKSLKSIIAQTIMSCPASSLDKVVRAMSSFITSFEKNELSGRRLHSIARYLGGNSILEMTQLVHSQISGEQKFCLATRGLETMYDRVEEFQGVKDTFDQMMLADCLMYLPDDILVKTDRASMANSLEVRSPLLDRNIIEWAWTVKSENKIFSDQTRGKKPLYDLLGDYLPEAMINRPKQGFSIPVSTWLRGSLNEWANDLLSEGMLNKSGLYDAIEVRKLWHKFQSGGVETPNIIWSILMAQTWYKQWHM